MSQELIIQSHDSAETAFILFPVENQRGFVTMHVLR